MEVQMRQFEQMQQTMGTPSLPMKLLQMVETFNDYSNRTGSGYLNSDKLLQVCMMWEFWKTSSPAVKTFMEYRNYKSPEPEKQAPVARKKKVPVIG